MYRAVIFDLDGTLLNTIDDLAAAGNHALGALGLPLHTLAEFTAYVGNGIPTLIRRMVPQPPEEETVRRAAAAFADYYSVHKEDTTAPYPGIEAMLDALRAHGVKLAVLSNKAHVMTRPLIYHYFGDRFAAVQGLEDGMAPKPDPAGVRRLLGRLETPAEQVLYVGDSDTDMQTAAAAGLMSCGVLWGFRSKEVLLAGGARHLCADTAALQALILGQDGGQAC